MSPTFEKFKSLHQSPDLFVLPNAWNAKSALIFQERGYPAIATSSAAVANSLGYEDGQGMPFDDYLFIIKRILSVVQIPLSVDIEMGYGTSEEAIFANILQLTDLGVVGINIEDSIIDKSGRVLKDAKPFAAMIESVKSKLISKGLDLFINIRCDTFLLNVPHRQQETIHRLKIYETTGADGIFLPCITAEEDIAAVVNHTMLPLNVMCIPGLPCFDTLNELKVKRVSMGPFMFSKIYDNISPLTAAITANKNFSPIFS